MLPPKVQQKTFLIKIKLLYQFDYRGRLQTDNSEGINEILKTVCIGRLS